MANRSYTSIDYSFQSSPNVTPHRVPPPAAFTIGGSDQSHPQPVPPPITPYFDGDIDRSLEDSETVKSDKNLPSKLYECHGTVALYQVW